MCGMNECIWDDEMTSEIFACRAVCLFSSRRHSWGTHFNSSWSSKTLGEEGGWRQIQISVKESKIIPLVLFSPSPSFSLFFSFCISLSSSLSFSLFFIPFLCFPRSFALPHSSVQTWLRAELECAVPPLIDRSSLCSQKKKKKKTGKKKNEILRIQRSSVLSCGTSSTCCLSICISYSVCALCFLTIKARVGVLCLKQSSYDPATESEGFYFLFFVFSFHFFRCIFMLREQGGWFISPAMNTK